MKKNLIFPRYFIMKKIVFVFCALTFLLILFSCMTGRLEQKKCSRALYDVGVKSSEQLTAFFLAHKPSASKNDIGRLARYYVQEGAEEHINSDVAFVQMCLETGWLSFGNLVTADMHNYCGLGAIDADNPGESFATEQLGVRAHIQHLHAYATTADVSLKNELIDPRYSWPHKAKYARTVTELAGHWATDAQYGVKLENLLSELDGF